MTRWTPSPGERVQVQRQRGHERLALAGLHLGDAALVQHHAADQLHVEVAHADACAGRPRGRRRTPRAAGRRAPRPRRAARGTRRSSRAARRRRALDLGLERVDLAHTLLHALQRPALAGAEDLLEDAHLLGWYRTAAPCPRGSHLRCECQRRIVRALGRRPGQPAIGERRSRGNGVRRRPRREAPLGLGAQIGPAVAPRPRSLRGGRARRQMRRERASPRRRETAVRLPQALQRQHQITPVAPRLELRRRVGRAQPHRHPVAVAHRARPPPRPLHADRAHRLLVRYTARLVERGYGGHGTIVPGSVCPVGDGV